MNHVITIGKDESNIIRFTNSKDIRVLIDLINRNTLKWENVINVIKKNIPINLGMENALVKNANTDGGKEFYVI